MSDLEARIAAAVNAHTIAAFAGPDTACGCDRRWRKNADHRAHVTESLTAMLAPVVADVWDEGSESVTLATNAYGGWMEYIDNPYRADNLETP